MWRSRNSGPNRSNFKRTSVQMISWYYWTSGGARTTISAQKHSGIAFQLLRRIYPFTRPHGGNFKNFLSMEGEAKPSRLRELTKRSLRPKGGGRKCTFVSYREKFSDDHYREEKVKDYQQKQRLSPVKPQKKARRRSISRLGNGLMWFFFATIYFRRKRSWNFLKNNKGNRILWFFHFLCPILNAVLREKNSRDISRVFGAEKRNILSAIITGFPQK